MLVAEQIRLTFPDRSGNAFVALDIERFEPRPGSLTVVQGPSGSGKSSLLYVLAGLLSPQQGGVEFDGRDIFSMGEGARDDWRRRTVGFVFQDFHLIPELSVMANVTLPGTFVAGGADHARARARLKMLRVPLDRPRVEDLSRGEQQRVAIARALLFDPPVVLADEPTASLDDAAAGDVRAILRAVAREGRTVVAVSHDRALIADADATLRLDHGHALRPREAAGAAEAAA